MKISDIVAIFIGGGAGSICRYLVSLPFKHLPSFFPWATFSANLIACLILGILVGISEKAVLSSSLRLLLVTGFCGGFSTFSTFSNEIFQLGKNQLGMISLIYVIASLVAGVFAIFIGIKIGEQIS